MFDFILNDNIWKNLSNAFINKKIPNAYIFHGNEGVGKEAHAIEFAATLNCKRPVEDSYPCGDCRSCVKIKKMRHEEIYFIHPSPPPKNNIKSSRGLDSKVANELKKEHKKKSENLYYKIQLSSSNTIPISSIRYLRKKLFFSKSDENWTVVIITDAEKLCIPRSESANSLLKILEEPPDKTLFILTTSFPNFLISTISSRCQKIFFPNLTDNQIQKFVQKNNIKVNSSCVELSNGSLTNMLFNIDDESVSIYKNLLKTVFSTELSSMQEFQEIIFQINNKNEICKYLHLLSFSVKDLFYLSLNIKGENINYKFLQNEYHNLIKSFPNSKWIEINNALNDAIKNIKNNVNKNLEIYNLLINVQYCLQGKSINTLKSELIK